MKNLALLFLLQVLFCAFGAKHEIQVLGAFDEGFATKSVKYTPSPTFNIVDTRTNKLEEVTLPACPPSTPTDSLPVSPAYPIVIKNEWEAEWLFELRLSLIIGGQEFRKHLKETHRKAAL